MPKKTQAEKNFMAMAGEFLVAAELNRRQILSAVTYGASKSADVWAFDDNSKRAAKLEVKTTLGGKHWITGPKLLKTRNWSDDVFWVMVLLPKPHPNSAETNLRRRGEHSPRFFIFTCKELGTLIRKRDRGYRTAYRKRHSRKWTGKGVVSLLVKDAQKFENQWSKIEALLHGNHDVHPVS